jgi:type IV pilus assembly protein PilB
MRKSIQIGEHLTRKGLITREQLEKALAEQSETKEPLGRVLLRLGYIENEVQLKLALSTQMEIAFIPTELLKPRADQRLKELVPKEMALENLILPLERTGKQLKLAISKPPDLILLDNLRKMTNFDIVPVLATEDGVRNAIDKFYSSSELEEVVTSSAVDEVSQQFIMEEQEIMDIGAAVSGADQAPVVKLIDALLKKAVDDRASDIHIEPFQDKISIRYRIDGILYPLTPPPRQFHLAMISRVKIISKLDIAEKRVPQDGAFELQYQGHKIDVRVSTIPVVYGEKLVMRLLIKTPELLNLKALGLEEAQLKLFEQAIHRPYGLVFITGPTGSGKSTTLYAAIMQRRSSKVNIITVEDPVEYQIEGINQVQVKPDIGLTFATGLRAFLRQDPDIILVGEVRDQETAEVCVRAALTGHLVFSTLHTNDAATAISRLADIGVKPYLLAGSLLLIGAQRLIRRLCASCKEPYPVDQKMRSEYGLTVDTVYKPKGCKDCRQIGYWGRVAIYEMLPIDEELRHLISTEFDLRHVRQIQKDRGYDTLLKSGMRKVAEGLTSVEEVLSVAYE